MWSSGSSFERTWLLAEFRSLQLKDWGPHSLLLSAGVTLSSYRLPTFHAMGLPPSLKPVGFSLTSTPSLTYLTLLLDLDLKGSCDWLRPTWIISLFKGQLTWDLNFICKIPSQQYLDLYSIKYIGEGTCTPGSRKSWGHLQVLTLSSEPLRPHKLWAYSGDNGAHYTEKVIWIQRNKDKHFQVLSILRISLSVFIISSS